MQIPKTSLYFLLILLATKTFAQIPDLFAKDSISSPLQKTHQGEVTFMNRNIPLAEYNKTDFLSSFELKPVSDLNIRVFMNNSVANYLHQLAPDLPTDKLMKSGNLQFSFYVDDKLIYKEDLNNGANFGSGGSKNTSITFRVPLTSSKGEDWWAMYMFDRFKANGGDKVLTEGKHQFRLELRPYIKRDGASNVITGDLIAKGALQLIIKNPKATAAQIRIQTIHANSGWEISKFPYDKKKIEQLNEAIAIYQLKQISSVVVIKDGQLLIEEYFNGANRNTLHDTRSAGKSFTSTLMGIAINDGFIKSESETLDKFYQLKDFSNFQTQKDSIKIKDLLTMSSAFDGNDANGDSPGNEENMYPTDNWVKFALDLPMDSTKTNGSRWDYFTAGVVVLGDILDKAVPNSLEKYADEKLFKPLNIKGYQWQYTPQKVVNTAGSLQMRSVDYAKYVQLYKNKGKWNDKQIIPTDWVEKTFTKQIQIPERENQYYGYLFWNKSFQYKNKSYETFYCAGNGGNEFLVFKDLSLVIVITSKAYNKPYAHLQTERIVTDYILPAIIK